MSTQIEGANAIETYIHENFVGKEALITINYGETVIAQFIMLIDDTDKDLSEDAERISELEAEVMTDRHWDRFAAVLRIFGDVIEAIESGYSTEATFIIDDPNAFTGDVNEDGSIFLWAGGQWSMIISRI